MAVNWSWKYKLGSYTLVQKNHATGVKKSFRINLYEANCLGACIYEYKENGENMYRFMGFWNDESHLKRCLGIIKNNDGYIENIYNDPDGNGVVTKIKLNMYFTKDALKIAKWFALAGHKVELYYKEIK